MSPGSKAKAGILILSLHNGLCKKVLNAKGIGGEREKKDRVVCACLMVWSWPMQSFAWFLLVTQRRGGRKAPKKDNTTHEIRFGSPNDSYMICTCTFLCRSLLFGNQAISTILISQCISELVFIWICIVYVSFMMHTSTTEIDSGSSSLLIRFIY